MAARSLNKVQIIGNLTRDPELRYTANGTAIASFGVATNREYVPSGGSESVEQTEFHNVVAWSKLGELCDKLLAKGSKVYIEGRLNTRDWVDNESGKKMYRTEIVAEEMIVLSSQNGPRSSEGSVESTPPQQQPTEQVESNEVSVEDDIPF